MPQVRETEIYQALLKYQGVGTVTVGDAKVSVSLNPQDTHNLGRPDFILWVDVVVTVFGQELKLRVPIPIEAEKNGIAEAIEDLDGYVERGKYVIDLPMLVVSEAGFGQQTENRTIPLRVKMVQIPIRRVTR